MKLELLYVDELKPDTKNFRIKVKAINKTSRLLSTDDCTLYETILFSDQKDNLIHGRLVEDEIDTFGHYFMMDGHYEITNALIKPMPKHFEIAITGIPYQLNFAPTTLVQQICPVAGEAEPEFNTISNITKTHFLDEICELQAICSITHDIQEDVTYDVLGVVLFVEEEARLVDSCYGQPSYVREVVITDQTNIQPIIINVWNHLAGSKCEQLNVWAEKFIVVGFTSVKPSTLKGFSLSTGMYSQIIYNPKGDRANVLREWSELYTQMLLDRQGRILQVRSPEDKESIVTIQYLKDKKAQNALQDERHWVPASIVPTSMEQLIIYIGCSSCGKPTNLPEGRLFACSKCYTRETLACIRVAFTFDAVDANVSISFTSLSNETEKIFVCAQTEDIFSFTAAFLNISSKVLYLKVGPSPALTATNKLQWILEDVRISTDDNIPIPISTEQFDASTAITQRHRGKESVEPEVFPNWSAHKRPRSSSNKSTSKSANEVGSPNPCQENPETITTDPSNVQAPAIKSRKTEQTSVKDITSTTSNPSTGIPKDDKV